MRRTIAAAFVSAILAQAAEFAVLQTGYRLPIERHEQVEGEYVLYSREGGSTRLSIEHVAGFEPDERPAEPKESEPPSPPADTAKSTTLKELIDHAARKHGLPEALVHSVVAAESAYQPKAVSPKGAVGLMQLMPETAKTFGVDPSDPEKNLEAGVRYLRDLLIKYDSDANRALAAYNAGPGAVDRYGNVPPYRETQTYVNRVLTRFTRAQNRDTQPAGSGQK